MATMIPGLPRYGSPPGEKTVFEAKSHDRVEVDDDGLWRLGSQAPTERSPYEQVWHNARSIKQWTERKAYVTP